MRKIASTVSYTSILEIEERELGVTRLQDVQELRGSNIDDNGGFEESDDYNTQSEDSFNWSDEV